MMRLRTNTGPRNNPWRFTIGLRMIIQRDVMAIFTATQGRYLAYIHAYTSLHGIPPAESEIASALCVSPPSVNQMVKALEKKGLILRQPGQARSLKILIPEDEIPAWNKRGDQAKSSSAPGSVNEPAAVTYAPPADLYVLSVIISGGPLSEKFLSKRIIRDIEIRGDQTLEQLHQAIFKAYDREEDHLYQFQLGKGPHDPTGPNFGSAGSYPEETKQGNASTTKLDDLGLKTDRVFGYWFDFGDDWYHQIRVDKIEPAIPTVTYPRVIRRVGQSPPQYADE